MRLHWTGLRRPPVPRDVAAAIAPEPGERLLAWAVEPGTGRRSSPGVIGCMP